MITSLEVYSYITTVTICWYRRCLKAAHACFPISQKSSVEHETIGYLQIRRGSVRVALAENYLLP